MQIKKTLRRNDGTWVIDAEFSEEEIQVILDVGLNTMLEAGAIPFTVEENKDRVVIPPSKLSQ